MAVSTELATHLSSGATTTARAWEIDRTDGTRLGFTDHDRDLTFAGLTFRADSGMSARKLQSATGLSVDNSEAIGVLQDIAVTATDIEAGRYDEARVTAWLVNWQDVNQRHVLFRGTIGEISRSGGAFRAELRGLTEVLNRPVGRIFQKPCAAQLGDASCQFDLATAGFQWEGPVATVGSYGSIEASGLGGFAEHWFRRGVLEVTSGSAAGLSASVKSDETLANGNRRFTLWAPLNAPIQSGDTIRVSAGCDKRFATCQSKFNNVLNYQGFPDIPESDWVVVNPSSRNETGGGSRR